jgi:flagellar biosynthesis protein FlhF
MATKSFKSDTVMETLRQVQTELGANAIVVSMREVPMGPVWNPWKKAGVEIVAASPNVSTAPVLRPKANGSGVEFLEERPEIVWEPMPKRDPSKLPPPIKLRPVPAPTMPVSTPVTVQAGAAELTQQTATQARAEQDRYLPPALKKLQSQLIRQGVEPALVENLLDVALETLSPTTLADAEACKKSIIELMGAGLRIQKGAGTFLSSNVACVVGASGSGKTSVVAKLALFFSQTLHKKVTWVCADTIRTGAVAEARAYTDALGLELKLVYTPADLKTILDDAQDADLYLVDTTGYNPWNEGQMSELGALLSEMPKRCTFLAASATTKETDLLQASAALGMFNIDGLVLTKLDETQTFGSVYNFARRNQAPLSFFTTGMETARKLEVADPTRLVAALFGKDWSK